MTALEDFENTLKEVVNAKRLSASKMTKLTEIAMKSLQDDTKLVAILYRTHKSLANSAKVSSLYAFDALARAARSQVNKRGITGDINSAKGNAATFLLKIEGVLDGLFQDMTSLDNAEAKEKTKKVLDIWLKSNTFPSAVLTRLRDILSDVQKENVVNRTPPIDPRVTTEAPVIIATPPSAAQSTPTSAPDVQSTLLALLGQAAQITGQSQPGSANSQTPPNTELVAPQLGHAQLALLQQLALTAKLGNGTSTQPQVVSGLNPPTNATPAPSYTRPPSHGPASLNHFDSNQGDPRYRRSGYSDHPRDHHVVHDDRYSSRGGARGGARGQGRDRWDDRNNHDRFRQRDRNWDPPARPRHSRSRSPRRFEERRNVRPYSPPHRPSNGKEPHQSELPTSAAPDSGKDEFGREIRPSSVSPPRSMSVEDTPAQAPMVPSVVPTPAAAPDYHIPVSDQLPSVAASTSAQSTETHTSSSAPSQQQQQGLDQFDFTTFDVTAPSSWEALGNMWQATYGYAPSQEELMQFIMTGSMVVAGAASGPFGGMQSGQWHQAGWEGQDTRGNERWRGGNRGRGSYMNGGRGGNFGHGNYRDGGDYSNTGHSEATDAIVLGGDDDQTLQSSGPMEEDDQSIPNGYSSGQNELHGLNSTAGQNSGGAGGRMQRVGDKWVFVKELASGGS